ncbi:MAG: D-aminoacylase, partial [candidate division Zixibacteria bacterium]|nr:D-aminoacylase [candidate division Zixibacteria bacterium]
MTQDIIIKNAKVIDGSGNPSFSSDIAVKSGKISKISPKIDEEAEKIIDGTDLVVCPGFIDMHSHSDYIISIVAKAESFVRQGITTCTIGMCGDGLAPIPPDRVEDAKKLLMTISPLLEHINISWNTFGEYLAYLDKRKCPINLVPCVGYNNIRIAGGAGFE